MSDTPIKPTVYHHDSDMALLELLPLRVRVDDYASIEDLCEDADTTPALLACAVDRLRVRFVDIMEVYGEDGDVCGYAISDRVSWGRAREYCRIQRRGAA